MRLSYETGNVRIRKKEDHPSVGNQQSVSSFLKAKQQGKKYDAISLLMTPSAFSEGKTVQIKWENDVIAIHNNLK